MKSYRLIILLIGFCCFSLYAQQSTISTRHNAPQANTYIYVYFAVNNSVGGKIEVKCYPRYSTTVEKTYDFTSATASTVKNDAGTSNLDLYLYEKTSFSSEKTIVITAIPDDGFEFEKFTYSTSTSTTNPLTITYAQNSTFSGVTVTAYFTATGPSTHTVTVSNNDDTYGSISTTSLTDITDGSSFSTSGTNGNILSIDGKSVTATPNTNTAQYTYTFTGWSNISGTVTADRTVSANFSRATTQHAVSATVSPAGAGSVSGTGSFDYNTDVTLTATPTNRRYQFSHWEENSSSVGTDDSYTINDIAAPHNLTAVFDEIPVTIADNEETSYYTATASTFTGSMDFQLMRTFYAGMWNTVCFPFDLNASQIAASDMSGATFYALTSVTGDAAVGLDFNVSEVTSLSARTPYLVRFDGENIANPVFEGVTLAASAFTNNTSGSDLGETKFFGTVHPTSLEVGESSGFLFLGQNNNLYWPNVANDIRAFRAYFYSGNSTVQAVHPRVRLVVRPETPTDVIEGYNADTWSAVVPARKVLDNGNLIIERDGIRYNAVGQIIR